MLQSTGVCIRVYHRFILVNPILIFFLLHCPLCFCLPLCSATIRNAFLLLLVATSTWLCGLMAVNNSILAFYYIFDVLCLVQVRTKHDQIHNKVRSLPVAFESCLSVCVFLFLWFLFYISLSSFPGSVSDASLHRVQLRSSGGMESRLFG